MIKEIFLESENLSLTQLSHLEPYANLDLNGDGVIGNIIYKKFGSDHHHGSSNHLIEQLKTYELMYGGYVLSKNEHSLNSSLTNIETDYHGGVIGPGLLLETGIKGKASTFLLTRNPFLHIHRELRMALTFMANKTIVLITM